MAANSPDSAQEKRKATRGSWKPGQSGNPKGRPKDGESWSGILREITNMTAEQLAEMVSIQGKTELSRALLKLPHGVAIKKLLAARVVAAIMFDPTPGLLNLIMDREEGKVSDAVDITTGGEKLKILVEYAGDES